MVNLKFDSDTLYMTMLASSKAYLLLVFFVGTSSAISFDKDGNSIEPSSSVAFPAHFSTTKQDLIGMTVRVKKIMFVDFKVSIHAV